MNHTDWLNSYIQTYLERDVRQIKNISNLGMFQVFLKMCAARTGQILNLSALANDCGISHITARDWLGILEASFIAFQLQPHHNNFNKRLTKTPKLYFYDTGLACSLMGHTSANDLKFSNAKGAIFETFVISELVKKRFNQGLRSNLFFWRDKTGHEIDVLIENHQKLTPVEIKSGKTISNDFFSNLTYWANLAKTSANQPLLIYGGDRNAVQHGTQVLGWKSINKI